MVFTENWIFSASLAVALCILVFIVIPSISNPFLKPLALALKPFGLFLIAVLAVTALVKFLKHKKPASKVNWNTSVVNHTGMMNNTLDVSKPIVNEPPPPERPTEWTLNLIREIEWKRFEELSTAYYQEKGIQAKATSIGADGGIDIKLYQDDSGNPTAIVQCKAWSSKQVGVKEIREFLGVMTHEKLFQTGWFVESLCTQIMVIFIIRTRRNPLKSRPNPILIASSLTIVTIAAILPFTSIGGYFGFVAPPAKFYFILGGMVLVYLSIVELVKQRFYSWYYNKLKHA